MVRAQLKVGAADFTVGQANIRATPPMLASNVAKCIAQSVAGTSVVGYNEMGGRDLGILLKPHGWASIQGARGDRARAPLGYDPAAWGIVDRGEKQLSWAAGHASISVPSGNRWATWATLKHRATGQPVTFVAFHAVAHHNVGTGFGWTSHMNATILALKALGQPNPFISCFKQSMAGLEVLLAELAKKGAPVVLTGDLNFQGLRASAEPAAPENVLARAGLASIYSTRALTTGTSGDRGIDVIALTKEKA